MAMPAGKKAMDFIVLVVDLIIILTVFLAVWIPLVRPKIFELLNESNFTATWGTELKTAALYVVDIIVFIVAFAAISVVTDGLIPSVKKAGGGA